MVLKVRKLRGFYLLCNDALFVLKDSVAMSRDFSGYVDFYKNLFVFFFFLRVTAEEQLIIIEILKLY